MADYARFPNIDGHAPLKAAIVMEAERDCGLHDSHDRESSKRRVV